MRFWIPLHALLLLAPLLAGCPSRPLAITTRVEPANATVEQWLAFRNVGSAHIAHLPDGGIGIYRFDTEAEKNVILERYDDTLGLIWSTADSLDETAHSLWLGYHSGNLINVRQTDHARDSVAVIAESHDLRDGAKKGDTLLGLFAKERKGTRAMLVPTRILTTPDSALLVAYTVDMNTDVMWHYDSVRVHAQMIDRNMVRRGSITLSLPTLPMKEVWEHHTRLLGDPVLDSLGRLYLALVASPKTVRIYRIDIESGTTSALDIPALTNYLEEKPRSLRDLVLRVEENDRVLVGAADQRDEEIDGLTLHMLDFSRYRTEFTTRIELAASLPANPDADDLLERLHLRHIMPAGGGRSILILEEVKHYQSARPATAEWGSMLKPGLRYSSAISAAYGNRNVVLVMVDGKGERKWTVLDERSEVIREVGHYLPDLWRIDGDTLHYLTRSIEATSIDLRTGSRTAPLPLLTGNLPADFQSSRWLDRRRALIVMGYRDYTSILKIRY